MEPMELQETQDPLVQLALLAPLELIAQWQDQLVQQAQLETLAPQDLRVLTVLSLALLDRQGQQAQQDPKEQTAQ